MKISVLTYTSLLAQSPAPTSDGFLDIVLAGGVTGAAIVLLLVGLSMMALALVVEHLMTIRRGVLAPDGLAENVAKKLQAGDLPSAAGACDLQPSLLATVVRSGLVEAEAGWPAVEKGMEDAAAEGAARLFRKIEYLSVIGNIAPMVGLLGTVVGMIFAFQEVANTQGAARAAELASGIYQALVTTVGGLIVAIPSLAAFAVFRNRVEGLVAETTHSASQATRPLKLAMTRGGKRKAESGAP